MYNIFYSADKVMDDKGKKDQNFGIDVNVYAMANQFTYMTDTKILGGDYGFDFIIPLVRTDVSIEFNDEWGNPIHLDDDSF